MCLPVNPKTRLSICSRDARLNLRTMNELLYGRSHACVIDPLQRGVTMSEFNAEMRPARLPFPTPTEHYLLRITGGSRCAAAGSIVRQALPASARPFHSRLGGTEDWPTRRLQLRIRSRPRPGLKALMLVRLDPSVDYPDWALDFGWLPPGTSPGEKGVAYDRRASYLHGKGAFDNASPSLRKRGKQQSPGSPA